MRPSVAAHEPVDNTQMIPIDIENRYSLRWRVLAS